MRQHPRLARLEYLEMALHKAPARLLRELQHRVDQVAEEPHVERVLLVFGLCGMGLHGLRSGRLKLVIPRVHDCISLFLGDRCRHAQLMSENPGRYFYTPGWNRNRLVPGREHFEQLHREYAEKYDEEDADYLVEEELKSLKHVNTATYIDLGCPERAAQLAFSEECARYMGWKLEVLEGDPSYLDRLLVGPWDPEEFLILEPGQRIAASYDDRVMRADPDEG